MLNKKLIAFSLVSLVLAGGFATRAEAGYGRSYCRPVAQSIKIGKHIRYTEYGTACNQTGGWVFVSENPHPHRYGQGFYFQERGRYVPVTYIQSPRHYKNRDWDRHDNRRWERHDRDRDRHDRDDRHDHGRRH